MVQKAEQLDSGVAVMATGGLDFERFLQYVAELRWCRFAVTELFVDASIDWPTE